MVSRCGLARTPQVRCIPATEVYRRCCCACQCDFLADQREMRHRPLTGFLSGEH